MQIRVDSRQLLRTLRAVIGERNLFRAERHLRAVEDFIESELKACGLRVESDFFSYRGRSFRNVIGRREGRPGSPLVIVGAHFDTVEGTPGADDNASGVAVLLEVARVLGREAGGPELLFCAFNLEELNMIGSTHMARRLKRAGVKVDAMISLEMVGYTDSRAGSQKYPPGLSWFYPDRGDFIGLVANWSSAGLLRKVAREMRRIRGLPVETLSVPGTGGLLPAVRLSDHSPFWDLGYPALLVTDTSFYRNPHYHAASDTLETLDLDFMARVAEAIAGALRRF
ncbi:MAG TPA: M28 family peptidase [candidate division Zixibacteria bacterium]|nr:M28 family peptidase [candidate division Zixibacteria bacterium]